MSNVINKIKGKVSGDKKEDEQSFSIQPHPAKTNDPADLAPPQPGGGLNSNPEYQAHHARDPHVPSTEMMASMEQPASREDLQKRKAELNK